MSGLDQIAAGKRNKVIAADPGISQSTVEARRAKVMDKLEVRSLSDAIRKSLNRRIRLAQASRDPR